MEYVSSKIFTGAEVLMSLFLATQATVITSIKTTVVHSSNTAYYSTYIQRSLNMHATFNKGFAHSKVDFRQTLTFQDC